ncbi:hypothetical protein [Morganella psychrotolerans]
MTPVEYRNQALQAA